MEDRTTAAKRLRRRLVSYTLSTYTRYTLKLSVYPLDKCEWAGSGDCVKNTCARGEVTLATDWYGDSDTACNCKYSLSFYAIITMTLSDLRLICGLRSSRVAFESTLLQAE
jgi:hypothetical protein